MLYVDIVIEVTEDGQIMVREKSMANGLVLSRKASRQIAAEILELQGSSPAPTATDAPRPPPAPRGEGSSEALCMMKGCKNTRAPGTFTIYCTDHGG